MNKTSEMIFGIVKKSLENSGIRIAMCCNDERHRKQLFKQFYIFCNELANVSEVVIVFNQAGNRILINNSIIYFITPNTKFQGIEFDYAEDSYKMPREFKTRIRPRKGMI